jgi:hypothetical protein
VTRYSEVEPCRDFEVNPGIGDRLIKFSVSKSDLGSSDRRIVVRVAPSVRKALPYLQGAADESSSVQCAASIFVPYRLIALLIAYAV